jgi:hypothetical protein
MGLRPRRGNAMRGSARGHRVTPARGARTCQVLKPSKPNAVRGRWCFGASAGGRGNGTEGKVRREADLATGGGNPLKVGNPGASPARNKAGRVAGGMKCQEAEKA